jgi:hypothetical protein
MSQAPNVRSPKGDDCRCDRVQRSLADCSAGKRLDGGADSGRRLSTRRRQSQALPCAAARTAASVKASAGCRTSSATSSSVTSAGLPNTVVAPMKTDDPAVSGQAPAPRGRRSSRLLTHRRPGKPGFRAAKPAAISRALRSRSGISSSSANRRISSRLGWARPVSTKLKCRGETSACSARAS